MAFAGIGAAELLAAEPGEPALTALAHDAVERIRDACSDAWGWPEDRLRYSSGSLPEALIAAGHAVGDAAAVDHGVALLELLLDLEVRDGRLSVTGVGGRGPHDLEAQFDQQPIEVGALADAAARAFEVTGAPRWRDAVALAWAWCLGSNDAGIPMLDPETGAGYDGLERLGRNENRGAESTLAVLAVWQHAVRLRLV